MKIAMLNCLRANEVCAGCACLSAFYQRRAAFARYAGTEVELAAFLRCNGCGRPPEEDAGMLEKLDRLKAEGVETVHLGVCTREKGGEECPTITALGRLLEIRGISVVRGTH